MYLFEEEKSAIILRKKEIIKGRKKMSFDWETLQCLDRHGNNVYNTSENSFYECLDMIPDSILDETNDTVHQPRRTDSDLYLPCHNSLNQSNDSKSSHQSDKIFSYSQVSSTNSTQQFYNNCLSDSFKEDDQFIESLLFDTTVRQGFVSFNFYREREEIIHFSSLRHFGRNICFA